jgi:bacillithiol system protein YtxJ
MTQQLMPNKGFLEIQDIAALDMFLSEAENQPVILFKHSNSCGISARAHRQMAEVDRPIGIVIVQNARAVSAEIERRFGLTHHTPQVLIVLGSDLLWNASHNGVSAPAVRAALERASSSSKQ